MSWQGYVDQHIVGPKITSAAIVGQQGGVWDKSAELELKGGEDQHIIKISKDTATAQASGVTVGGTKYMYVGTEELVNQGMLVFKKGADGCIIAKTNMAILIALHSPPIQMQESLGRVLEVVAHLKGTGY
ncbi:Profilin [Ceratobasidium theobromae]|uniref:Profilin n=1 Tax=Ceratobasidium theobromae TaxID=1582974 RepID=A0A5N5QDF2_9AGAM|nr:Profilin [Ceratobasidium theobromae]